MGELRVSVSACGVCRTDLHVVEGDLPVHREAVVPGHEVVGVVDALGESLLVYHQRPFEVLRRVHLGGGPYAISYDPGHWGLWIALAGTNRLVNYAAGARPVPRDEFPSIRNAREVIPMADAITVRSETETQVVRRRSR